MEVSGQLHAPAALPPGKDPPVPNGQEAGWAPESFWTQLRRDKKKHYCPCRELNHDRPARILVSALTELSQLPNLKLLVRGCKACYISFLLLTETWIQRSWSKSE
jgi:hypothetical protein